MRKQHERSRLTAAIWLAVAVCLLLPSATKAQNFDAQLCASGLANCSVLGEERPALLPDASASTLLKPAPSHIVNMYVRTLHGGPLAHHWIEVESSRGPVTVGYGPATIPFIDAGQISIWYAQGTVERRGAIRLISTGFNYAKPPGSGRPIGEPIQLTIAQADALVQKQRRRRFVFPYIPIFHDCRTFVCAVQSSVRGKSTLPCYLLFKGYW
jgi:hypothetical protein